MKPTRPREPVHLRLVERSAAGDDFLVAAPPSGDAPAAVTPLPHPTRAGSEPDLLFPEEKVGLSLDAMSSPERADGHRVATRSERVRITGSPKSRRARRDQEEEEEVGPLSTRSRSLAELMELHDAKLVPLARAGQPLAFEALYRKHVTFALHLATRIEGSARDVEDVVHDAFIKAFGRLGDLSDPGAFRSWLGSIVVFAVRSRLRRARLMSLLGLGRGADPIDLDSITSSDASPHTRAQLAQIYALLRTLPTDERIGWTLRYVEGHELDVVAKLTSCSLATVKRRIGRAQKFLEQHFVEPANASEEGPSVASTNAPAGAVEAGARVSPIGLAAVGNSRSKRVAR